MAPKMKKGAPAPPKAEVKEKTLKAKKAMLKGVHSHKKNIHTSPTFWWPKMLWLQRQPKYPRKSAPRRSKLDHCAIIKFPLSIESTMKKMEDSNALGFRMNVRANKHQIKQAVTKLYDTDMVKVNTLIRPDGEKKANVPLAPDYDAADVVNKIGIIQTESSWLIINIHFSTIQKERKDKADCSGKPTILIGTFMMEFEESVSHSEMRAQTSIRFVHEEVVNEAATVSACHRVSDIVMKAWSTG
ncbi:60S ribosomal protein L23a-like [Dipodomys spectabilis]|uniref:60S ribosomal protein L23a-like n=1 Tax=Dipodomys spectabilis TaxID=105255 RepID=UPI001C53A775|nr:60S ribosomal protein L23a-like [Dipodomys spectabilis]